MNRPVVLSIHLPLFARLHDVLGTDLRAHRSTFRTALSHHVTSAVYETSTMPSSP